MNEEFTQHIEIIRSLLESLPGYITQSVLSQELYAAIEDVLISLDNLQLIQEQTQAVVEVMEVIQEELTHQSEYSAQQHQHYYDAFNLAPEAYLLTDGKGVILEAFP
ncbi:MAG: hypothetical protein KME29_15205 [Calothrix sp. FI2-JRJ7]|jgi:hypothetical protein|nr:hypothetical protein [Calothrix sp. FI2-JRJ7]